MRKRMFTKSKYRSLFREEDDHNLSYIYDEEKEIKAFLKKFKNTIITLDNVENLIEFFHDYDLELENIVIRRSDKHSITIEEIKGKKREFMIFEHYEYADELALETIKEVIKSDISFSFSGEHIIHYINEQKFKKYLIQMLHKKYSPNKFKDHGFSNQKEYKDFISEKIKEMNENLLDYLENEYGYDWVRNLGGNVVLKYLDIDSMAKDEFEIKGAGPWISSYDGTELVYGDMSIFRLV